MSNDLSTLCSLYQLNKLVCFTDDPCSFVLLVNLQISHPLIRTLDGLATDYFNFVSDLYIDKSCLFMRVEQTIVAAAPFTNVFTTCIIPSMKCQKFSVANYSSNKLVIFYFVQISISPSIVLVPALGPSSHFHGNLW